MAFLRTEISWNKAWDLISNWIVCLLALLSTPITWKKTFDINLCAWLCSEGSSSWIIHDAEPWSEERLKIRCWNPFEKDWDQSKTGVKNTAKLRQMKHVWFPCLQVKQIEQVKQMIKCKTEGRQIRTWSKAVDWAIIPPPRFHRRPTAPSLRAPEIKFTFLVRKQFRVWQPRRG